MPANFSNLRLRYTHIGTGSLEDLVMLLNLSSINFDINQSSIGPRMPFTSELSFDISLENETNLIYSDLEELEELIKSRFGYNQSLSAIEVITLVLREHVFTSQLVAMSYNDVTGEVIEGINNIRLPKSEQIQIMVHSLVPDNTDNISNLRWKSKLKLASLSPFREGDTPSTNIITDYGQSLVLYPQFSFNNTATAADDDDIDVATLNYLESTEDALNDELRLNYELLYLPPVDPGSAASTAVSGLAGALGAAADELSDSITNLQSSLNNNLSSPNQVQLQTPGNNVTYDLALWALIKMGTDRLQYHNYAQFIEQVLCGSGNVASQRERNAVANLSQSRSLPFMNADAYRYLKIATEAFVMVNCAENLTFTEEEINYLRDNVPLNDGVFDQTQLQIWWNQYRNQPNVQDNFLPYLAAIRSKLNDVSLTHTPFASAFNDFIDNNGGGNTNHQLSECYGIMSQRLENPCFIELIWSYWHEEGMQEQGMKAIMRRFQNVKGPGRVDPLANMEIDPLRPLNNLLWGYVQDEKNRLSVRRRAYEYNHHYGISLKGSATKNMRFADSRSKFIEAFHRLLNIASRFYKQADDMTVKPDGFPILNALREVHLVLSEGAHNQFGDMPSVSRAEMLMQQWMFAQPQFREVLPTRVMVAFPEPWMDRVAAMNNMMGWTQTSVLHFHYLGYFGEQLLLSIRFGNWSAITDRTASANWANFWREQIQGYIHAYQAATGVDLSADSRSTSIDSQSPSTHLYRRLMEQKRGRKTA